MERDFKLPNGYWHLEQALADFKKKMIAYDEAIESVPQDKGYRPELKPSGAPNLTNAPKHQWKERLEAEKVQLQEQMMQHVAEQVKDEKKEVAKEILDKAGMQVFNPKFSQLSAEELSQEKSNHRSLEESQQYALVVKFDQTYKQQEKVPTEGDKDNQKNFLKTSIDNFVKSTAPPKSNEQKPLNNELGKETGDTKKDLLKENIDSFLAATDLKQNSKDITQREITPEI